MLLLLHYHSHCFGEVLDAFRAVLLHPEHLQRVRAAAGVLLVTLAGHVAPLVLQRPESLVARVVPPAEALPPVLHALIPGPRPRPGPAASFVACRRGPRKCRGQKRCNRQEYKDKKSSASRYAYKPQNVSLIPPAVATAHQELSSCRDGHWVGCASHA